MFKFKVDPADVERTKLLIKRKFDELCNDPAMLQEQGKFVSERIRFQARTAKPINDSKNLPNLAAKTVSRRRYLSKYNRTDPTFSAERSNLTLTGQFLNSLGFDITGPGEVTLSWKGTRTPYKGKKGVYRQAPLTNAQLAGYLRELGFEPYSVAALNQSQPIKSRITAIVKTYLRRALKLS